jgi:hypothetical protein
MFLDYNHYLCFDRFSETCAILQRCRQQFLSVGTYRVGYTALRPSRLYSKCLPPRELKLQADSKLLSGFPFIGHGNSDNNLESTCNSLSPFAVVRLTFLDTPINRWSWMRVFATNSGMVCYSTLRAFPSTFPPPPKFYSQIPTLRTRKATKLRPIFLSSGMFCREVCR